MSAPVDERGVDAAASGVVQRLWAEHERLDESARSLERLVPCLDDERAVRAFVAHLEFVHEFCELLHFPLEDALLEVVLEAGLTPSERRVFFVNLAQHQQMYADALRVLETLRESPRSVDRSDLKARAETYARALRGHLDFETRHLQPLLLRHLTPRAVERLEVLACDLRATVAGRPLERIAELDAASRVLAAAS